MYLIVCFKIHTFEKTDTSPSLYQLALHRGNPSAITLARDSETFFGGM